MLSPSLLHICYEVDHIVTYIILMTFTKIVLFNPNNIDTLKMMFSITWYFMSQW